MRVDFCFHASEVENLLLVLSHISEVAGFSQNLCKAGKRDKCLACMDLDI